MSSPDPGWAQRVESGDTVLTLPRGGPAAGAAGFVLLWVVGVALAVFLPGGILVAFWPGGAIAALPLVFLAAFLAVLGLLCVWVAAARDEVRVGGGILEYARRLGPVRKRSVRLDTARVHRFIVIQANARTGGNSPLLVGAWSVLFVEDAGGRRQRIGLWYRREVLLAVAEELAGLCGLLGDNPADPAVVDDPDDRFYPTQPSGSRLALSRGPDGITVAIPPLGRRALDRYFWGCSVFFPLLVVPVVLIGYFTLQGAIPWQPGPPPRWVLLWVMVVGGCVTILLGLLLGFLHLVNAYGRSEVRVTPAGLEVDEPGVFRPVRWTWPGERVADVAAEFDPKDQSRCLVVAERDGTKSKVLGHLPLEDLQWLAARIRETL